MWYWKSLAGLTAMHLAASKGNYVALDWLFDARAGLPAGRRVAHSRMAAVVHTW